MKKTILILSLFALNFANAQRVAFINEQKILSAAPNYETNLKEVKQSEKVIIDEINQNNVDLESKLNKLLSKYGFSNSAKFKYEDVMAKLSKADKRTFEELQKENNGIQQKAKTKQEEFQKVFKDKVGGILEKTNTVVREYCKKNKIDLLLKTDVLAQGIAYYNSTKDITEEIISLIKK